LYKDSIKKKKKPKKKENKKETILKSEQHARDRKAT
jgi:hypothetical protein